MQAARAGGWRAVFKKAEGFLETFGVCRKPSSPDRSETPLLSWKSAPLVPPPWGAPPIVVVFAPGPSLRELHLVLLPARLGEEEEEDQSKNNKNMNQTNKT